MINLPKKKEKYNFIENAFIIPEKQRSLHFTDVKKKCKRTQGKYLFMIINRHLLYNKIGEIGFRQLWWCSDCNELACTLTVLDSAL